MTVSPTINLTDMVQILRVALEIRFGCPVNEIIVESHGKPRICIDLYDMVSCEEFRHNARNAV